MSGTVLQSASSAATGTGSTTWSATFSTANLTAGTKLIVCVGFSSGTASNTVTSVKDGAGNTFTQAGFVNEAVTSRGGAGTWFLDTPAGDVGTKPTITVTFAASCVASVVLLEVANLVAGNTAALAVSAAAVTSANAGAASIAQPSYTPFKAGDFLVVVEGDDGGPQVAAQPAGYTISPSAVNNNANASCVPAYKDSAGGAEAGTWTFTGTLPRTYFVVVAFRSGISIIGQAGVAGGSAASPAVISRTTVAGNTLILTGHLFDNNGGAFVAPTSVTDTAGNTWQISTNAANSALTTQTPPLWTNTSPSDGGAAHNSEWVAWCIGAAAVTSVTVAWQNPGTSTWRRITLAEVNGIVAFDNSAAGGSLTATTSATAGPCNVSGAGELAIGVFDFAGGGTLSEPAGWTVLTGGGVDQAYLLNPPIGSLSPVFTTTAAANSSWAIAVFSPVPLAGAAAASPGPLPQRLITRALPVLRYQRRYRPRIEDTGAPSTPVALADTAAGEDADPSFVPAAAVPLADPGAAAEALAATVTLAVADAAGAAEAQSSPAAVPLPDAAGAADAVTVPAETITLPDAAGAADAAAVSAALPLGDAAGSTDRVAAAVTAPLADAAAAAEGITAAATAALPDVSAAADQQSASVAASLAEAVAGVEAAGATVTLPLAEQAGAAEALLSGMPVTLADNAGAGEAGPQLDSNPAFAGASTTGWVGFNGTITGSASPPAGCPEATAVQYANGGVSGGALEGNGSNVFGAQPSVLYTVSAWVYTSLSGVVIGFDWQNASHGFLSSTTQFIAVPANTWTPVSFTFTSHASAVFGYARVGTTVLSGVVWATDVLAWGPAGVPGITAAVPLADPGAGADAPSETVTVPLADPGAAADAAAVPAEGITLADAAAAADAPQFSAAVPLSEAGAGAEAPASAATVPLADPGAAADAGQVSAVTPVADTAGAADATGASAAAQLADSAGVAETPAAAVTAGLADAGAAADAVAVTGAGNPALAEAAAGADTVAAAAASPAADAAAAADALGANVTSAAGDQGAAADAISTTSGQVAALADAGAGSDTLAAAGALAPADASAASDALSAAAAFSAADAGASADSQAVAAQVPLAEAAGAADGLTVVTAAAPVLGDAGGVTDALRAAVTTSGSDTAAAGDSLVTGVAQAVTLADRGAAAEALVSAIPPAEPQPSWDSGAARPGWQAVPAGPRWQVDAAAPAWLAVASPPRWAAAAAGREWVVIMAQFEPIASVSMQNINVTWTSDLGGVVTDPTAVPAMPVKFAFPVSSGDENRPAQPAAWFTGLWLPPNGRYKGFISQCPVGPTALGGLVQLAAGQSYDVWSEVDTGSETVREFVGVQRVY